MLDVLPVCQVWFPMRAVPKYRNMMHEMYFNMLDVLPVCQVWFPMRAVPKYRNMMQSLVELNILMK